jgi:hypothetical protein
VQLYDLGPATFAVHERGAAGGTPIVHGLVHDVGAPLGSELAEWLAAAAQ